MLFIGEFVLTKFHKGNVVKTVRLLQLVGELLVDLHVIKMLDTVEDISLGRLTEVSMVAFANHTPRRQTLDRSLTELRSDTIDHIRYIESHTVPTSDDIWVMVLPVVYPLHQ